MEVAVIYCIYQAEAVTMFETATFYYDLLELRSMELGIQAA
jgi:hypothetical protein